MAHLRMTEMVGRRLERGHLERYLMSLHPGEGMLIPKSLHWPISTKKHGSNAIGCDAKIGRMFPAGYGALKGKVRHPQRRRPQQAHS